MADVPAGGVPAGGRDTQVETAGQIRSRGRGSGSSEGVKRDRPPLPRYERGGDRAFTLRGREQVPRLVAPLTGGSVFRRGANDRRGRFSGRQGDGKVLRTDDEPRLRIAVRPDLAGSREEKATEVDPLRRVGTQSGEPLRVGRHSPSRNDRAIVRSAMNSLAAPENTFIRQFGTMDAIRRE